MHLHILQNRKIHCVGERILLKDFRFILQQNSTIVTQQNLSEPLPGSMTHDDREIS